MADAADPAHEACRSARDEWLREGRVIVTTDYVVDETLTLIRMRLGLDAAAGWWRQVDGSALLRWEWIDAMRAERARSWFFEGEDKDFSFTDRSSFVVMREVRSRTTLTTDRHFAQAGFEVVP